MVYRHWPTEPLLVANESSIAIVWHQLLSKALCSGLYSNPRIGFVFGYDFYFRFFILIVLLATTAADETSLQILDVIQVFFPAVDNQRYNKEDGEQCAPNRKLFSSETIRSDKWRQWQRRCKRYMIWRTGFDRQHEARPNSRQHFWPSLHWYMFLRSPKPLLSSIRQSKSDLTGNTLRTSNRIREMYSEDIIG